MIRAFYRWLLRGIAREERAHMESVVAKAAALAISLNETEK